MLHFSYDVEYVYMMQVIATRYVYSYGVVLLEILTTQ